jgi:hypothetical protein
MVLFLGFLGGICRVICKGFVVVLGHFLWLLWVFSEDH